MDIKKGKKLPLNVVINRIEEKCKERNISFLGFYNEDNTYKGHSTKLKLKCNKCGCEWSTNTYHKFVNNNRQCPKCVFNKRLTINDKILNIKEKCIIFDFTFLGFDTNNKNLKLKCNKCGYEWNSTTYANFMKKDRKHHTCGRNNACNINHNFNVKKHIEKIIINLPKQFELIGYNDCNTLKDLKIKIKCHKCDETFEYSYTRLYSMKFIINCKKCERFNKFSNDEVIKIINEKCKLLDYTFLGFNNEKNYYTNKNVKLKLKCNKCGREWNTTSFNDLHKKIIKCVNCVNSWKMEKEIEYVLLSNRIRFERQKTFEWLKYKSFLYLDFYLPDYNIAIECQGRQHFESVMDFGGDKCFNDQQKRDLTKYNLCKENNIKLLYYSNILNYNEFLNEKLIKNNKEIIKYILNE